MNMKVVSGEGRGITIYKRNISQNFALLRDAIDVRRRLERYFSLDGRIPWQDDYVQRAGRPR